MTTARQSSITVAVRVRPFTQAEANKLISPPGKPLFIGDGALSGNSEGSNNEENNKSNMIPRGIRKIVDVVDDKMLIFDPPATNPLTSMQRNAFPNGNMRARIRDYRFVFDSLFDEHTTQEQIYERTTRPLLDSILDGYNSTVFAYGATGCGKTHTISGSPSNPGVIFLTMKELYERIDALADTRVFEVSISFLEIYNETIRDLLEPETSPKKLVLREDCKKRITVSNLSSRSPASVDEVMDLIVVGNENRTSSPTEANAASSRSHAVLQINVTSRSRTASLDQEHTFATLSIIDLAGSERAAATKNRGARLNEGANINKSLLALGNCINALCDPRRKNHVPYRDSKLTRLLKFSLGGNCKTVMIVCVSPSSQHYDETLNTLKYANRAKEIKTKLIRNRQNLDRHVGSYLKMITEQKQEIEELRERESKIIESTVAKHSKQVDNCIMEILKSIESLKLNINKQHQEKWRKCFSLAKRKLLLLHQEELQVLIHSLKSLQISDRRYTVFLEKCKHLLIQAEQLLHKTNEQIINLEKIYDSPSEIDHIFSKTFEFTLKKFQEMEGWSPQLASMYEAMVVSTKEHLQKDLLVNSSILLDYLVGELSDFNFVTHGLCELVGTYMLHYEDATVDKMAEAVSRIIDIIEAYNNSDYDMAIEKATSRFIQIKLQREEQEDATMARAMANAPSLQPRDKRTSTSPLRSSPPRARKRSSKNQAPEGDWDISMDDSMANRSAMEEDTSPPSKSIDNRGVLDDLDFNPTIESPTSKKTSSLNSAHPSSDEVTPRAPLLNKGASTKVVRKDMIPLTSEDLSRETNMG
ncbi:hypothetical protein FT663_04964 [Candidozyma haemuli var. vulneris]|nr:hypothetical protein FT662_05027 [[Candida] haemuloni var. vulneris]KAF3986248.1 hypothetical protein FT663_04964 [[Candida] haemuloni var. vulneris]